MKRLITLSLLISVNVHAFEVAKFCSVSTDTLNPTVASELAGQEGERRRREQELKESKESAQPIPAPRACSEQTACADGQNCVNGLCVSPPPAPPSALQRAGTELYVRQNVLQLRQDLALGEGPVIVTLARMRGDDAKKLGQLMRRGRDELARTLGDARDSQWPARFLAALDKVRPKTEPNPGF